MFIIPVFIRPLCTRSNRPSEENINTSRNTNLWQKFKYATVRRWQNILTIVNSLFGEEYNMKMNKSKTEIFVCCRNEAVKPDIKSDGETLEVDGG